MLEVNSRIYRLLRRGGTDTLGSSNQGIRALSLLLFGNQLVEQAELDVRFVEKSSSGHFKQSFVP
jgi:hypothetical protein